MKYIYGIKEIPNNKRIITFINNPKAVFSAFYAPDEAIYAMRNVLLAVENLIIKNPEFHLVVKLHPYHEKENLPEYKRLFNAFRFPENISVFR